MHNSIINKVNIIGSGFVGLTLASVLMESKNVNEVTVCDINKSKIDFLKNGKCFIHEPDLNPFQSGITYTTDINDCNGDIYFICVGTPNFDFTQYSKFVTDAVKSVLDHEPDAIIVLKSTTTPENIAKVREIVKEYPKAVFFTNPEFLAEGTAVIDLKRQDVLIFGSDPDNRSLAKLIIEEYFYGMYLDYSIVGVEEAMICKYYLNSYKAMKVTFNNEFNNYCKKNNYSFSDVLNAVKIDPAVGLGFDKPGVGFGGSCFPKDTLAIGRDINICAVINSLNEINIKKFATYLHSKICGLPANNPVPKILFGGKSFKSDTNDTRDSVALKVKYALLSLNENIDIKFFDRIPQLSDFTLDEVKSKANEFDLVVLFNNLPELREIFKDEAKLIDTRKV